MKLIFIVTLLFLVSCSSTMPKIDICVGDGYGGADCIDVKRNPYYMLPSQLENFNAFENAELVKYYDYCYRRIRNENPPIITICIVDSYGGADCYNNGSFYKSPSELEGYIILSAESLMKLIDWCN